MIGNLRRAKNIARAKLSFSIAFAFVVAALQPARAVSTDGSVAFSVTLTNITGTSYGTKHLDAVWVMNSSSKFIQTMLYANSGNNGDMTQWKAQRGTYGGYDGVSSATITGVKTWNLAWHCRDTNNVVVPDGTYYIRCEYASTDGNGPYTTNWVSFVKGAAALTNTYPDLATRGGNFSSMSLAYTLAATDLAITAMSPSSGFTSSSVPVQITVANLGTDPLSFTVFLSNVTSTATLIGTQRVNAVAGGSTTNVIINWNTTGVSTGACKLRASAGPLPAETFALDNVKTNTVTLRNLQHDISVTSIGVPAMVPPNVATNITVAASNAGDFAESFTLSFTDQTASLTIGTKSITNLPSASATNVIFSWNTTNATLGYHTLLAIAGVVTGETLTANNSNIVTTIVASGLETNSLIARGSVWKYLANGLDISAAPWIRPAANYYDGFWSSDPGALGYALSNIATTVSYGSDPTNLYTTTYFRRDFTVDVAPMIVTGTVRRVDGVVLYLNGVEIARHNMPIGMQPGYSTLATTNVTGAGATNYVGFSVTPGSLVIGHNILAAELHKAAPTNSTLAFDLDLTEINPKITRNYRIAATSVQPDGNVQTGDSLGVSITVSNAGNAAATFTVLLKDVTTGAIIGSQQITGLAPGETSVVHLTWPTLGASAATHNFQALTVVNGVTNTTDVAASSVVLAAPTFAARTVNAASSIGGRCNAVAASGNYVYLGCGATLEIWDASTPSNPSRVSALRLPGRIESLAAVSGWVYAAAGASGVHIINAGTPGAPVHSATYDTSGHACKLCLVNNNLFIADGVGGVRILNVANPAAPTLAGAYQTVGPAQAITASGQNLLMLDGHSGLQVLSATNPVAPTLTGTCSRITAGLGLAISAGAALASDANGNLFNVNISAPSAPVISTNVLLPAAGRALAVAGSSLFVADGSAGLLTLNPSSLAVLATNTSTGIDAGDIAIVSNTLYLANGFGGAQAYSISSTPPVLLGTFRTSTRALDAAAIGPALFVAGDEGGLQVHSLLNPLQPALQAAVATVGNARSVAVAAPFVFVGDAIGGLAILNATNPAAPAIVGMYSGTNTGLGLVRRVAVSGSRVVLTDGRQLQLVNVSTPSAPSLIATNVPGGFVFDIAASMSNVVAACGLAGVRIMNPANLNIIGNYSSGSPVVGVAVNGSTAYLANGFGGWQTLSIANPAAPTVVQSSAGSVFGIAAAGSLAYLTDARSKAQVMNVSAPLTPVSAGTFATLSGALRVSAMGGLALASEDESGLAILNASPNDINLDGLPDTWEQQQIVNVNSNGTIHSIWDVQPGTEGANGYTYAQSYIAGLTPSDPDSVLAVQTPAASANSPSKFVVTWASVAGKTYTLYKSTNLVTGFSSVTGGLNATPPVNSYTDTVSGVMNFYMISTP